MTRSQDNRLPGSPPPTVSIITVVLNGAANLCDCLDSVARQRGVALEHLVIDGGSTDGTLDILEARGGSLAYWSSGKDKGIADAMNRGVAAARGHWLLFIHADDYLIDSQTVLADCLGQVTTEDVAAFPVLFGTPPALVLLVPRKVGWWVNFKMRMCHQGMLTRRTTFETLDGYDLRYRVDMDYHFLLKAHRKGARISVHQSPTLSVMRAGGISSRLDWPSERRRFLEERAIHREMSTGLGLDLLYAAYWAIYLPYRRLRAALR
jgi:glycosyltransferase involved in cell wall biosynthesis